MKKLFTICILISISICYTSCSYRSIGNFTIVSTRNIDAKTDYKELRRGVVAYDKGRKLDYNAWTGVDIVHKGLITAAIENAIRSVQGGEFMKNVEIFDKNGRVKIIGDVWGLGDNAIKIGDRVMYKSNRDLIKGQVIAQDNKEATVKYFDNRGREQIEKVSYDKLTKYTPDKEETAPEAKFKVGQKVSWTEYSKIKYGIIQDVNAQLAKTTIKYMLDNGIEKVKTKSFDDIFVANETDYQNTIDKIQTEVKKHTFKAGDKVKWLKTSHSTIHAQVISFNESEMKVVIKYSTDKGLERNSTVDAFDVMKDE